MNWFGEDWGAPICTEQPHTETPVGRCCYVCDGEIRAGDNGFVLSSLDVFASDGTTREYVAHYTTREYVAHYDCFMRTIGASR